MYDPMTFFAEVLVPIVEPLNSTVLSDLQFWNEYVPRTFTPDGIIMLVRPLPLNAEPLIVVTLEGMVIEVSNSQPPNA